MGRNYFNLDEAEIDNILMINLFPKSRSRLNFSNRETFVDVLMPEIIRKQCQLDFIANLIELHQKKRGPLIAKSDSAKEEEYLSFTYDILFSPPKYLKLAVLMTLDSLED